MNASAAVLIPRINHVFDAADTIIRHNYDGFTGFEVREVPAAYRNEDAVDGYGAALVLRRSQVDLDFKREIIFLKEYHVCDLIDTFLYSDELTEKWLGRSWTRPRSESEDLVIKLVRRLIKISPDFARRLAKGLELDSKYLAKLLLENASVNARLK